MSRTAWAVALIAIAATIVMVAVLAARDPYERPLVPFHDDEEAQSIFPIERNAEQPSS